jgi:hypothetical protein
MKLNVGNIVKLRFKFEDIWAEILYIDEVNGILIGRILDYLLYKNKYSINDNIEFQYKNIYGIKNSILDYN